MLEEYTQDTEGMAQLDLDALTAVYKELAEGGIHDIVLRQEGVYIELEDFTDADIERLAAYFQVEPYRHVVEDELTDAFRWHQEQFVQGREDATLTTTTYQGTKVHVWHGYEGWYGCTSDTREGDGLYTESNDIGPFLTEHDARAAVEAYIDRCGEETTV